MNNFLPNLAQNDNFLVENPNLTIYFHCPNNLYEKGTLYVYGFKEPEMNNFPSIFLKMEDFDLRFCHPSISGVNSVQTQVDLLEEDEEFWFFAWVDVSEQKGEVLTERGGKKLYGGFLNFEFNEVKTETEINVDEDSTADTILAVQSDPAGIAYSQTEKRGIFLKKSSSENEVYITLEVATNGFPRFGWPYKFSYEDFVGDITKNTNKYLIKIYKYDEQNNEYQRVFASFNTRGFFCEQDILNQKIK